MLCHPWLVYGKGVQQGNINIKNNRVSKQNTCVQIVVTNFNLNTINSLM